MKLNIKLLFLLVLGSILLSACSGSIAPTSWAGMSVSKDTIYISYASGVYAVKLDNGNLIWQYPEKPDNGKHFYAEPAVVDGQVVVGDYKNHLYAIDAGNGNEKWTFTQAKGHWVGGAVAESGMIYAPNSDHKLYALDTNGSLKWDFETQQSLWAKPAMDDQQIYLPSMDHKLYALKKADGKLAWSTDLGSALVSTPLVNTDGVLYTGTIANELVAVNTDNGKVLWRYSTQGSIWSSPVVKDNAIYFGDAGGMVYALNTKNGDPFWKIEAGEMVSGSPGIIENGLVYATGAGDVVAVSFDGKKMWTKNLGGKLRTPIVVANERILVATESTDKLLVALDQNGNEVWFFAIPK